MPPQIKNYRNYLVEAVMLIVASALFFWFIILPKQASIAEKNETLAKVQDEESKMAGSLSKLQEMVKQLETSKSKISELDQAIPLDGNIPRFQMLLETLANSVGLTVGSISVTGNSNGAWAGDKQLLADPFGAKRTVQKLSGSIYVIGTYDQLKTFLNKFETNGRMINISSMNMDAAPDNALNLKVSFDAYYLAP